MPKLTENVLIGERVFLAGEEVSEADTKGVRPEVFESVAPVASVPVKKSTRGAVRKPE